MIFGEHLNIDVALAGCTYTKIENPAFRDKSGESGLAMGGRFSSVDELKKECCDYDVYIHSLQDAKQGGTHPCFWAVYACREKTPEKTRGLAPFNARTR